MLNKWYENKITAFFVLCAISLVMLFSAAKIEIGFDDKNECKIYSIEFDYYGVDSRHLLELIVEPLENEISKLEDVKECIIESHGIADDFVKCIRPRAELREYCREQMF